MFCCFCGTKDEINNRKNKNLDKPAKTLILAISVQLINVHISNGPEFLNRASPGKMSPSAASQLQQSECPIGGFEM